MADVRSMEVDEEINLTDIGVEVILPKSPEELAEIKKEKANQLYKNKQYRNALPYYTEAIELCPSSAAYLSNRSACYMMLNKYVDALEDARRAVSLDTTMTKGYLRIIKCAIALGDITTAEQAINKIKELEILNPALDAEIKNVEVIKQFEQSADAAYEKKDFRKVVYCMDRALDVACYCTRLKIRKAECLAFLGRYQESLEIANSILHLDKTNADAIYVRGICLFYQDNVDKAFSHFQQVLRLAPDHKKAMDIYKRAKQLKQMKEEGNEAFKGGLYQEAYNLYTQALKIDPFNIKTNAKLYFNKACVSSHLENHREAVDYCTEALQLDENYLKALLLRAKCNMILGEYEDAVKDYEKAVKMDKSRENKRLLQEAKSALKKSKRKDYYKILGVDKNATEDEIKKAYRKRALMHHPDRHASASESEKKQQEKKFKEVGEAYGILSDPRKKGRYDTGQDMEDFECSMPDPTQVFHTFFGGGRGTEFNFQSGGYPGGFTFQFG